MPNIADYLQRGVVLTCVAMSIWGAGVIYEGHSIRMARAREAAAKMAIDPSTLEQLEKQKAAALEIQNGNPT